MVFYILFMKNNAKSYFNFHFFLVRTSCKQKTILFLIKTPHNLTFWIASGATRIQNHSIGPIVKLWTHTSPQLIIVFRCTFGGVLLQFFVQNVQFCVGVFDDTMCQLCILGGGDEQFGIGVVAVVQEETVGVFVAQWYRWKKLKKKSKNGYSCLLLLFLNETQ